MKIKKKIILVSLCSFAVLILSVFIIWNMVFNYYMNQQKYLEVTKNYDIINKIIDNEILNINNSIIDWSHWDDTYNFVNDKNLKFIKSNLQYNTLKQLNLNMIAFLDINGNIIYHLDSKSLENDDINYLLSEAVKNKNINKSGLVFINDDAFIISVSKIIPSNEIGDSDGTLIFVRQVNDNFLKYIKDITGLTIQFSNLVEDNNIMYDNNYIILNKVINNIDNDNSIGIRIVKCQNKDLKYFFMNFIISLIIIIIITGIIFSINIDKYILKKLLKLNEFMHNVTKTRNIKSKIEFPGNDEFSELAEITNSMFSEMNNAYEEIIFLSYRDTLTKLNNRSYIEKQFEILDNDPNSNYFIIMGDLNGLKLTNDALGHKEGDKLLIIVSDILKENCQPDDIVSRWGGDEFIILIQNKDKEYVLELISKIKFSCDHENDFYFKISIGLGYAYKNNNNTTTDDVMKLAEEKMYRNKLMESSSSRSSIISSLMKTLNEKHSETEEHTLRITELGLKLGKKLGLQQDKLDELELVALLHDIGKIGIPENILMKSGKLTSDEWNIMKTHSDIGYRIVKSSPELAHIADEILAHHEKYDGTGYPNGLKGEDIPLISRIINVVDSFDAITNKRVYKEAVKFSYAIKELQRCSGTQFDPCILNEFIKIIIREHNKDNILQ